MSDIAIKVENLGKYYQIDHNAAQSERYTALRDVIAHNAKNLARKTRDMFQGKAIVQGDEVEEFWALKDINFEIKQGDRVGIIGRNGAGKSTLLKILSRITEPTTGRIQINGRVASLLEVGTGFHPELTGRENIFLNGAILGMSRKEIQRKFDEIVDFAEVEKFLDTPVKRYSSGMYVRLAFAVAAHLESEILVVDEVLAVGDGEFQKKCLGKMEDVADEGRTVLFVSHNIESLRKLCLSGILLKNGAISESGKIDHVIMNYTNNGSKELQKIFAPSNNDMYISRIEIDEIELNNGNISIRIFYKSYQPLRKPNPGIVISLIDGTQIFSSNTKHHKTIHTNKQENVATFTSRNFPICDGTYVLSAWLGDSYSDYDKKIDVITFNFKNKRNSETSQISNKRIGHIEANCQWDI